MRYGNIVAGIGFVPALTERDIQERYALVKALKDRVGGRALTDAELDRVIEPVECKRSRARSRGARVHQERL